MSNIDPTQVAEEIEIAIERQFEQGASESICEILENVAANSFDFWQEAACELHRQKKFNDSFECWLKAETFFDDTEQDKFDWYLELILTLDNASNQTDDPLFWKHALEVCEKLRAKGFNERVWNLTIELLIDLHSEPNKVLRLIEEIFVQGFELTAHVPPASLGINDADYIVSLSGVAEYYLKLDQPSEALRVWGLAVKNNVNNSQEELCNAIYTLNHYAVEKGFEDEEFLPSKFERVH